MLPATYHMVISSDHVLNFLQRLDHSMIFILIAGSYTPFCLIALDNKLGWILFSIVGLFAVLGVVFKLAWFKCPRVISTTIYIVMGWLCIFSFSDIVQALSPAAFGWLLAGGIIYTIGGIIYALKLPVFNKLHRNFGSHEIFHLFCLGGSLCHFVLMYLFVVEMPIL